MTRRLTTIDIIGLIVVGGLLIWQDAVADTWVEIHGLSKHYGAAYEGKHEDYQYTEINPGLGIEHEVSDHLSLGAGYAVMSYGEGGLYGGIDIHTKRTQGLDLGLSIAYVEAYKDTPVEESLGVPAMILPNVTYTSGRFRVKVGMIPDYVTTMSVGVRF